MEKIVFFELEEWEALLVKNAFVGNEVICTEEKLNKNTVEKYKDACVISTFIYSQVSKEVIDQLPNLKYITTRSTGFDHIDVSYAKEKQIPVSNVPSYGEHTVAEHTFALILALSRKIVQSVERTRRGDFSLNGLTGFDLSGKTLGVLGTGKIGTHVIELGLALQMKILAYNRHSDEELEKKGVKFVPLDEVLGNADVITLHLPYNKETHHTINAENITKIKKGALLINTARGGLVETQAIVEALEKEILSGVGLDVLEEEGALKEERELLSTTFLQSSDIKTQLLNHVLLDYSQVIITPHNAFNSKEALAQILEVTIQNISGFFKSAKQNLVE